MNISNLFLILIFFNNAHQLKDIFQKNTDITFKNQVKKLRVELS